MSNNAIAAYEDGEKPISKWTKAAIIEAIENQDIELHCSFELLKKVPAKLLKDICLRCSSWHHTSNHYNRTDFYSLDVNFIESLTDDKINDLIAGFNSDKSKEKEPEDEVWQCAFLEWSGSRKHPKATEITEEGIVKGDWFYRKDGSKKKTTANGFRFIKRIQ